MGRVVGTTTRGPAKKSRPSRCDELNSTFNSEMVPDVFNDLFDVAVDAVTTTVVIHEVGFELEVARHFVVRERGVVIEDGRSNQFSRPGDRWSVHSNSTKVQ